MSKFVLNYSSLTSSCCLCSFIFYSVFVIDSSGDIPPELIVTGMLFILRFLVQLLVKLDFSIYKIAKTLLLQPADFNTLQKLQNPKITHEIRNALIRVLKARMEVYSTSIEVWFFFAHSFIFFEPILNY